MNIREVTDYLESLAPRAYQESYDNSGLLTGNHEMDVTGILTSLDCTEAVVQEAIDMRCNLIVAHHPIVFKGVKKLTGSTYVERTLIKAIKHDIAIYAIHTNLDHVHLGVNKKIADKIGLLHVRILEPRKDTLGKLVTFVPHADAGKVLASLHEAGAGHIGHYTHCSFQVNGTGTFRPTDAANPHIGTAGTQESVEEARIEVLVPRHLESRIIHALKASHPYEEVAYYLSWIENENQEVGAGMIGTLPAPMEPLAFLKRLKDTMELTTLRHTALPDKLVSKIAVCGGSGSFLLPKAIQQGADLYITADFKYHEFFDADGRITIADIGHYESEIFTKELLKELLMKKFPTFAVNFSGIVTNPISYL